jgi:hypothetical protein
MQIEALPPGGPTEGHRMRIKTFPPGEKADPESRILLKAVTAPPPGDGAGPHVVPLPPGAKPGDMTAVIMKRLEMLDRRLEKMQDEIRRLHDERQNKETSERRVVPRDKRGDGPTEERRVIEVEIDDRPEPRPNR